MFRIVKITTEIKKKDKYAHQIHLNHCNGPKHCELKSAPTKQSLYIWVKDILLKPFPKTRSFFTQHITWKQTVIPVPLITLTSCGESLEET